jgi:excinuclease UvrABC helicase subunit UvrB
VPDFNLNPAYNPTADQPKAISSPTERVKDGERFLARTAGVDCEST